jgi:hypothetical protein
MTEPPDKRDSHYYRDDGSEINPELVSKPSLCVTCANDDDPEEEIVCILTQADQEGEAQFMYDAYRPKKR